MVVGRANQFLAMRPRMGILLADAWSHRGHAAATRYKKGVALRAWALLHFRIVGVVFHFYEANALSSVAVPITIRPSSWPPKLGSETGVRVHFRRPRNQSQREKVQPDPVLLWRMTR
jgi:hypothetical protein